MNPLISIVIPVYNGEKTLISTLNSVLKQTCSNFEVILVDDGSDNPVESFVASLIEEVFPASLCRTILSLLSPKPTLTNPH